MGHIHMYHISVIDTEVLVFTVFTAIIQFFMNTLYRLNIHILLNIFHNFLSKQVYIIVYLKLTDSETFVEDWTTFNRVDLWKTRSCGSTVVILVKEDQKVVGSSPIRFCWSRWDLFLSCLLEFLPSLHNDYFRLQNIFFAITFL